MASKWASFRSKLPAFVAEDTFQQKVDESKQFYLGTLDAEGVNINRLAAIFESRKAIKEGHEEAITQLNIEIEALSQLLCDAFENEGMQKVELSSGGSVYLSDGIYPSVEDRDALFAWIKAQRMQKLLSVNAQTLKGLVGELLQAGKPCPPGVKVFLKTQARMRNGKGDDSQ